MSVWGLQLYFGSKIITNGRTSHLYVVSNRLTPNKALKAYRKRWAIEVLFGHLKKKGFDLESTHLREHRRIDNARRGLGVGLSLYDWLGGAS